MIQTELDQDYYLRNFHTLLETVVSRYEDLLSDEERVWVATFDAASEDARRLYVRLISRRGPVFRADKLAYPEIRDIAATAETLVECGLLTINEGIEPERLCALWTRPELFEMAAVLLDEPPAKSSRKPELVQTLCERVAAEELHDCFVAHSDWYSPVGGERLLVFQLLFFGNLDQDLSEFVISDLGHVRYEDYSLDREHRMFEARDELNLMLQMLIIRAHMYEAIEARDAEALVGLMEMIPEAPDSPLLTARRDRLFTKMGSAFERLRDIPRALQCFERSKHPPARERRARLLARNDRLDEALRVTETILAEPVDELEHNFAVRYEAQLRQKLGLANDGPAPRRRHPTLEFTIPRGEMRIEPLVLAHLAAEGVDGFKAENQFWLGLFGLIFWDICFMPLRGAFHNPYQRGPLDLYTSDFRRRRREMIEARLDAVASGSWHDQILARFDEKQGVTNALVYWSRLSRDHIERVLTVFDPRHLAAICDRLSQDVKTCSAGFPDLVLFQGDAGIQLVEVKGPGDQLQPNQRAWLNFFADQGIPYGVAKIRWAD